MNFILWLIIGIFIGLILAYERDSPIRQLRSPLL